MAQGPGSEWTVVDFELVRGTFPIRTFLDSLEGRHVNAAAALIEQAMVRGNRLGEPISKRVRGDLMELRKHQVRIFYVFQPGRVIVLLDGVIKKQDKLAPADVERAERYAAEVKRRGPRAP
jgi:hypothetical protein